MSHPSIANRREPGWRWLAAGQHALPTDTGWLSPREVEQAAAMRFTKRRTEFLLRRWVGKQAVRAARGVRADQPDLARIEVGHRPGGAPLVLVDGQPTELTVSLTDRAGWAVCLVAPGSAPLGCDLELVEPRSPGFVADYLTEQEQAFVAEQPSADARHAAANLLWSAKESALKVLGVGLRADTRTVAVTVGDARSGAWGGLTVRTGAGAVFPGWWRRDGVFLLTVCATYPLPPPGALPGSSDLSAAQPVHPWADRPTTPT